MSTINVPNHLQKLRDSQSLKLDPKLTAIQEEESEPADSRSVFLFDGVANEVIPRRLFLDNRLTPAERNGWVVFRMLMGVGGRATPRYDDLQPYLAKVPCGEGNASRETIARIIANLRLTGWMTLAQRQRDAKTGRIVGSVYIVHENPINVERKVKIDKSYISFVGNMLHHPAKATRILARKAKEEIEMASPTLAASLAEIEAHINLVHRDNPLAMEEHQPARRRARSSTGSRQASNKNLSGVSKIEPGVSKIEPGQNKIEPGQNKIEPGQKMPSSKIELGINKIEPGQNSPGSKIELGEKPHEYAPHQNSNTVQYSTSTHTSICNGTVLYCDEEKNDWLDSLRLSSKERSNVETALTSLPGELRRAVLHEAKIRIQNGEIRNPGGYLMAMIKRAEAGEFKPWASIPPSQRSPQKPYYGNHGNRYQDVQRKPVEEGPYPYKMVTPSPAEPPVTEEQKAKFAEGYAKYRAKLRELMNKDGLVVRDPYRGIATG